MCGHFVLIFIEGWRNQKTELRLGSVSTRRFIFGCGANHTRARARAHARTYKHTQQLLPHPHNPTPQSRLFFFCVRCSPPLVRRLIGFAIQPSSLIDLAANIGTVSLHLVTNYLSRERCTSMPIISRDWIVSVGVKSLDVSSLIQIPLP